MLLSEMLWGRGIAMSWGFVIRSFEVHSPYEAALELNFRDDIVGYFV
jgi:hypothetical protein